MGVKLMDFGIYMRKGVIFTVRGCSRLVWNHPFLVCVVYALIYMSRSYPYMFSLLVSASPVLVCTAVLLGTLLFSGQQSILETETEKKMRYEAVALKNGMSNDANVDEKNERCCVERYSESKRDEVEKVGVESGLLVNKLAEIRVGGSVDGAAALSKERRSVGNESESSETWEVNGELDGAIQQQKSEWNEERLGDGEGMVDHYAIISKVIGELLESESEHEKSEEEDFSDSDSERENVDSPPHASWKKQVQRQKEEEEEDEDASDSGSDGAESSSPDASIDGMMPMLDELHPLLDEDTAQPVQMSRVGSEAALTEHSPRSTISSSSIESGEETEIHGSEAADDEEEEAQGDKKDQTKSVITWTEEDQKNLMDVGSSEIERNQRLERILRRRKNMSMVPEINLIDFENSDFQLNIAPISTVRRNPFDLPHDSYDSSAPGSAPSILLQRRNPFDLPYDQDEMADESREELRPSSQSRQPFLRRRDNFLARPSIFAPNRQDRQPARFRPFFIPEQTVSEESSYSSFQGQSSGMNCGHETESVSSVEYLEDQSSEDEEPLKSGSAPDISNRDPVYDTSPGKNYSSSSSFSDAHAELDPGLPSHKRTQGEAPSSSSHCNDHGDLEDEKKSPNSRRESWIPPVEGQVNRLDCDEGQDSTDHKAESKAPDHPEQG